MAANIPLAMPKQCSEAPGLTSRRKQVHKNSTKFGAIWCDDVRYFTNSRRGCDCARLACGASTGAIPLGKTGGEGGIRTLGTLFRFNALAKRRFRPLSHLTRRKAKRIYSQPGPSN